MARKLTRKQKQAIREQKETRKFFMIAGISTAVILVILFLVFLNS